MLVPARRLDPEWMDRPDNPPEALEGALRDIRWVNRLLGGSRAFVHAVLPYLDALPDGSTLEVLDVGTGSADLPIALVAAARARGRRVRVVAVDRDPATVRHAAGQAAGIAGVEIVRADATALPFPAGSFDLVTASLFLHHFAHDDAVRLLASFRRIARRAVLVNDLQRHRLPWAFIALAARATRRHPMFVHDAPLSVLRGFTGDELLRAGRESGASTPRVEERWPYRLVMTLDADGAAR